jgi:hypothetical protein
MNKNASSMVKADAMQAAKKTARLTPLFSRF